jgi:N-acetylglucosaminyl-diphospho-decaprenol L-rhamnosyltransferase
VKRPTRQPKIGLVTVSFRSAEKIESLIRSLPAASSLPLDVVVVDNVPEGDGALRVSLRGAGATLIERPDNPGYGGGINAGVAALPEDVEWILVANPDVVFLDGAIDTLLAAAIADDRIGAVGPRIIDSAGETYPSARAIPSLRVGVGHALLGDIAPANPWTRDYHRHRDYESQRDSGWLSGACILVRRSAFDAVGGFDDAFFMYFEDVDLGYRLGRHGWRNVFVPSATVVHEGGHSTKANSAAMIAAHHVSARRWIAKRYRGLLWSPVRVAVIIGLRVRQAVKTSR